MPNLINNKKILSLSLDVFLDCTSLQEIRLPDSLHSIGWRAFKGCTSLKKIHLPDSLRSIFGDSFRGCTSLQEIRLPDSLRYILTEFFPRYVEVLQPYSDKIVEVRIEGNSSLEWHGDVKSKEAYFYNMKLSQDRAFNVLQYVYGIDALQNYRPWLIEKLRANGASYSKANENAAASRCVEISIKRVAEKELRLP